MTELEKAAQELCEAIARHDSTKDAGSLDSEAWRQYERDAHTINAWCNVNGLRKLLALTQALAKTEPVKPLFAAKVAAQKWAELQEQGHRMQTIWFDGGPGGAGTIDPWGKVTWSKIEPTPTERKGEPVALQHMAVAEDGVLRWMTGRKIDNCELYAMPDFGRAPTLYTSPQAPEGFALVPVDATQVMRDAGNKTLRMLATEPGMAIADRAFYVWKAMADAARKGE